MILPEELHSRAGQPLDLDLIRKYSIPGPRYTSYPPATKFTEEIDPLRLEEAIADDNRAGAGPLSLYFHLPFCETRCWFCGCNTVITRRLDSAGEYLDDLARELSLTAARLDCNRPVTQIHLGGGTPTFFPPDQLRRLGALIRQNFRVDPDCEFGVEIDPRRLTAEHVLALSEIGASRASLGVQDTNPRVQLAIHRIQPHWRNEQAFAWLRNAGFKSINVDLIYGLPLQTPESFASTIDEVLALGPDRLSVFSYAHVPWIKPAQKIFDDRAQLPGAQEKLAMFATANEKLTRRGLSRHRAGSLRKARRRTRRRAARGHAAPQFPGLQHAGRRLALFLWHLVDFLHDRHLPAKRQDAGRLAGGPRRGAVAHRTRSAAYGRRRASADHHHAPDVRPAAGFRSAFRRARGRFFG